jgi:hypothetical protein
MSADVARTTDLEEFDFEDALLISLVHTLASGICELVVDCWSVQDRARVVIRVGFEGVFMIRLYCELPFRMSDAVVHDLSTSRAQARNVYTGLKDRGPYKVLGFTIGDAERSVDLAGIRSEDDILVVRLDAIGVHLELACRGVAISAPELP